MVMSMCVQEVYREALMFSGPPQGATHGDHLLPLNPLSHPATTTYTHWQRGATASITLENDSMIDDAWQNMMTH